MRTNKTKLRSNKHNSHFTNLGLSQRHCVNLSCKKNNCEYGSSASSGKDVTFPKTATMCTVYTITKECKGIILHDRSSPSESMAIKAGKIMAISAVKSMAIRAIKISVITQSAIERYYT